MRKEADAMDDFYKPAVAELQQYIRKCQRIGQTPEKGDFIVLNETAEGHAPTTKFVFVEYSRV